MCIRDREYAVRADAMKGKLYGMALLYLGSASLAVDAVDEAVYKGLRACEKLREEQFFGTWLTRIPVSYTHLIAPAAEDALPEGWVWAGR